MSDNEENEGFLADGPDTVTLQAIIQKMMVPAHEDDQNKQMLTSSDILQRVEDHADGYLPQDVFAAMTALKFSTKTISTRFYWLVKPL